MTVLWPLLCELIDISSIQFSRSVVSDSSQACGVQNARLPTPGAFSNSCPLSQWCQPIISSSVIPFSSCLPYLQSCTASRSFPMSQFFASGGQKYWSFSFSISLSNEYSDLLSFRIDCYDLLAVRGTLENLLQHHSWKASILHCSAFFMVHMGIKPVSLALLAPHSN